MNELLELLKMPIPSMAGLILLWIVAERAGLPLTSIFKSLLNLNGNKDIIRNYDDGKPITGIRELNARMISLELHLNEETTPILGEISEKLKHIADRSENQCKKLDHLIESQKEFKENDVEWRHEVREIMRNLR